MLLRLKILLPVCSLFFAGIASADVNLFNWTGITIDTAHSNPAIAPFTDTCPPYPASGCNTPPDYNPNTGSFPDGFPLGNMFGMHEQTAEGTYDTIFNGTSGGSPMYDNVYFTMNSGNPISHIGDIFVDGSQDGASTNRSFFDFLLWTYTDVNDLSTYKLLFSGATTPDPTTGYESLHGYVNANNVGPNFVAQFYTTSPSGVRVFDVVATAPEPADFLAVLPLLAFGACTLIARRRRGAIL